MELKMGLRLWHQVDLCGQTLWWVGGASERPRKESIQDLVDLVDVGLPVFSSSYQLNAKADDVPIICFIHI